MTRAQTQEFDIVVVGGGPAGLSFACLMEGRGLKIAVIEGQAESTLGAPPYDGRDIALTHKSIGIMRAAGILDRIPEALDAPIKHARVLNGNSDYSLHFFPDDRADGVLGWLASNHLIRRACYEQFKTCRDSMLIAGQLVRAVNTDARGARVTLADGRVLNARLVVAADSRFSETRRKMGIPTQMRDFGRVCIVCRMGHAQAHDETAYECFRMDMTLAVLPVSPHESSVVLTLASDRAQEAMSMDEAAFNAMVTERFHARFGPMALAGTRHAYPLVATYARRFHAQRFALLGDAAVGMHPVTAHGFNFGLSGAQFLADEITRAQGLGLDIGSGTLLEKYTRAHRRATHPLYLATNMLVGLYTDTRRPARMARDALLRLGNAFAPVRKLITRELTSIPAQKRA
ncbi:MAG: 5-demethoxyubiquinol-8 5-hydroxylase UbiM [Rhodospirillales bacterium]|nr:5-demethoxyubiquinol-8 5-hydroxylase UbiM [Alphaproteobacteria bacterium]MCB9987230.1 5-demethoxyubiquinol-8 5-hydroxylase UbiM [Rhodospirillales bacterium]USO07909.1 MAG: 5-demethoxyubiquinol-8 5-hydroxylase UbiM [Rhodospirillales bacterium]